MEEISKRQLNIPICMIWVSSQEWVGVDPLTANVEKYAEAEPRARQTDDWVEKGMYVANSIGCQGFDIFAKAIWHDLKHYVDLAHSLGLIINSSGEAIPGEDLTEEEIVHKLQAAGVDHTMSEHWE